MSGHLDELPPESEAEMLAAVDTIVQPSRIPGSKHFEEVFVKMCHLIKAQRLTDDPALFTVGMQVWYCRLLDSSP